MAKIKNANKGLVPVRNWVVAAEKYGKTFDKNKPIVPEVTKNPEPVRTPQRKVRVPPKKQYVPEETLQYPEEIEEPYYE